MTQASSRSLRLLVVLGALLACSAAWAIDSPPTLVDLQLSTPSVNSEFGPDTVIFIAEISDVAPGLCTNICDDFGTASQIRLVHRPTGQRHSSFFEQIGADLYRAEINLPEQSAIGTWQVEALWLADLAGNRQALSTAALGAGGFPTTVTNTAASGDSVAPAVTAASVSPAALDATGGGTTMLSLSVDDPLLCTSGCGIEGTPSQVRYRHAPTGQIRNGLIVPNGVGFSAEIDFPAGSAGGLWMIHELHVVDRLGNRAILDASDLSGLGFMTDVSLTSMSADLLPPELVSSSNFPDPIDSTLGGQIALFEIDANDLLTGLCLSSCDDDGSPSQVMYKRFGADHFRFGLFDLVGGTELNGIFEATLAIPQSGSPAVWMPYRLMLVDRAGNRRFVPEPGFTAGILLASLALARVAAVRSRRRS